jgi:hypothetical protein
MKIEDVAKSFRRLVGHGGGLLAGNEQADRQVDRRSISKFVSEALTLIRSVFGADHPLYERLARLQHVHLYGVAAEAYGVVAAAESAWKEGFHFDLKAIARADVESDLIDQASTLLASGYDRAAAVLAGAVLEEHLRSIAPSWGVAVHNAAGKALTLEPLNVELKKEGAYDGIMQKRITLLGGVRNEAAHGNPFDGRADEVRKLIRDVVDICGGVTSK